MKKIVIVGGGSAGWMTASYLSKHHPDIEIQLIEDKDTPIIGVGEATTPYLMRFFKDIGIENESDWMPHVNATYKNGILYDNWDHINSRFWHAFEVDENKYVYWNKKRKEQGLTNQDYWTSAFFTGHLAMRDSGKWLADDTGEVAIPYYHTKAWNGWPQHWAYNIDSWKFGDFLKTHVALPMGVKYRNNVRVKDLIIGNDGNVESLVTETNEKITADLFIDCTGFRRQLIDKVAEKPFSSFEPYLTHDKACVIRHPYLDPEIEMKPRTGVKALSSGWMWNIPLYDQISNGYVFTSSYISDDQAEFEMKQHLGFNRTKDAEPFIVDIKAGYYPKTWNKNVVAIGLSSSFIEPLESTSLLLTQVASQRVSQVIKGEIDVEKYNQNGNKDLQDFIDYISVGYYFSHRNDSQFWRDRAGKTALSDRMEQWVDQLQYELVPPEETRWFVPSSWITKAIGFNRYPKEDINMLKMSDASSKTRTEYREVDQILAEQQMKEVKNFKWEHLLSQKEFLEKFRYASK